MKQCREIRKNVGVGISLHANLMKMPGNLQISIPTYNLNSENRPKIPVHNSRGSEFRRIVRQILVMCSWRDNFRLQRAILARELNAEADRNG